MATTFLDHIFGPSGPVVTSGSSAMAAYRTMVVLPVLSVLSVLSEWVGCTSTDGCGDGLRVREPWPARVLERLPLGPGRLVGLPQVVGRRPDAVGERLQLVEVEAVELRLVAAEDLLGLVDRDVPEPVLQELPRVGPRALGMGEVVAPHDVGHTDLVAAGQRAASG